MDGLSGWFYQKSWDVVGNDVTKFCLQVLEEGIGIVPALDSTISPENKPLIASDS